MDYCCTQSGNKRVVINFILLVFKLVVINNMVSAFIISCLLYHMYYPQVCVWGNLFCIYWCCLMCTILLFPPYNCVALLLTRVTRTFLHKQWRPTMISLILLMKSHGPAKFRKLFISQDKCSVFMPHECIAAVTADMCHLTVSEMASYFFV